MKRKSGRRRGSSICRSKDPRGKPRGIADKGRCWSPPFTPLLIITKLEQYDYQGATALAVVMLLGSFAVLLGLQLLQRHLARPAHA